MTELSPELTPASVARLRAQWRSHWNTSQRLLVEKSPPDLLRTRFLAAVFPPAWFAVIIRHPLAVCKRVKPPAARLVCAQNWLAGYEGALRDVSEGRLTAHVAYYEDWAARPIREMERLSAELGLPFTPSGAAAGSGGFCWADVIEEGADANLSAHAASGWGYSGPLTADGVPDVSGQKIFVDGSKLLPEAALDAAHSGEQLPGYRVLEGRLNAFGYSFFAPFATGCAREARRTMSCPLVDQAG